MGVIDLFAVVLKWVALVFLAVLICRIVVAILFTVGVAVYLFFRELGKS